MTLKLNDIAALEPSVAPYKVGDDKGLYLLVLPSGRKFWRFRYRWARKQNDLSCGRYPEVTLEQARARRDEFRRFLADGINPNEPAKQERQRQRDEQARQRHDTRFMLDSKGALTLRLGNRLVNLTPEETAELRDFLAVTAGVARKV